MTTRARIYGAVALAVALAAWAHLRAIPALRAARHYEAEAADLKPPRAQAPSATALRIELAQLREERDELEQEQARRTARTDRVSQSLQTLARAAGLELERLTSQAPGARPGRSVGPPQLVLVASGDFAQVQRLVTSLEGWQGQGRVERLELALESDPQRPGPLRLELEVRP